MVTIVGEGSLWVTKAANLQIAAIGDTIIYDIHLRNVDVTPTYSVTVQDTLAQMLSYISSQPNGVQQGKVIEWNIPQINAGESVHLQLKCLVIKAAYRDSIENVATYTTSRGIRLYSNKVYTAWDPWPEGQIEKSVSPKEVYVGDTLTYTFRIQNTGPMPLSNVRLDDPLPRGVEYLDSTFPVDTSGHKVTWYIGTMAKIMSVGMTFKAIVTDDSEMGTLTNTAYMNSAHGILDSSQAEVDFHGRGIGLEIIKEAAKKTYSPGDTVVYDLILKNPGARPGHSVVVRDTLPEQLDYINATHNVQKQDDVLIWQFDHINAGFHDTLHVKMKVPSPIEHETRIDNVVWARTSEGLQDSSHWQITIHSYPEFTLKMHGPATAVAGETFCYDIIYSNVGTATAFNPVLSDTLPSLLGFVSAEDPYQLSADSQAIEWLLPPMAPGESDTVTLCACISNDVKPGDEITNEAWLSDEEAVGISIVIASCMTTTKPGGPGFYAYKKVNKPTASLGDTLTYTVYYGFHEKVDNDSALIYDQLPDEVTWIENHTFSKLTNPNVVFDPVTNELTIITDNCVVGREDSIQFQVIVDEQLSPGVEYIDNIALFMADGDTLSTEDDERSDADTRLIESFLTVKKAVNHKMSEIGDILTYTVTIENKSDDDPLTSLLIDDLLPEGFCYLENTSILDSAKIPDPEISMLGKRVRMLWNLPDTLHPAQTIHLKYRVAVGLSVHLGEHENHATASGNAGDGLWIQSGIAKAAVLIRPGILDTRGFIFGKVYEDQNQSGLHDNREPGLKGVELILEDGTHVTTDEFGKYSIPNVEFGQHVLRLNEKTLPEGSVIISKGPRFMGDPKSQLIRLSPGGMAKANFAIDGNNDQDDQGEQ